jgi:hypothetical protein
MYSEDENSFKNWRAQLVELEVLSVEDEVTPALAGV